MALTYYVTVHRDEEQLALLGEPLDACNSHMVFDAGYDLEQMRSITLHHPWKVIWEMQRCSEAKFGWRFKQFAGIPA